MMIPEAITNVIDGGIDYLSSWEPYAAKTLVLVPSFIQNKYNYLIAAKYLVGFLVAYPLGLIMLLLPYGKARHTFAFLSGAAMIQWILGPMWIHSFITSLTVYGIFYITNLLSLSSSRRHHSLVQEGDGGKYQKHPPSAASSSSSYLYYTIMKWIVPTFLMSYLTLVHLHRMYTNYLGSDPGAMALQMILTQKLYTLTYNIYDGYILSTGNTIPNSNARMNKDRKIALKCEEFAIKNGKVPDLIDYLGYVYCFSTVLIGPTFEFSVYRNACNGSLLRKPGSGEPRGKKIPYCIWPTLKPMIQVFVMMMIHGALYRRYNHANLAHPRILRKSWLRRILYAYMSALPYRIEFYLPWKFAEGATNIWYGGFDGFDANGDPKGWTNGQGVDIYKLEFMVCIQQMSKTWNIKTSNWLKRYVYYRCNGSIIFTYFISALWHGFYPVYYLIATSIVMYTYCERLGRRKVTPYFVTSHQSNKNNTNNNSTSNNSHHDLKGILSSLQQRFQRTKQSFIFSWKEYLYYAISAVIYHLMLCYILSPFYLKSFEKTFTFWKSHYFLGHISFVLYFIIVSLLPTPSSPSTTTANHINKAEKNRV